MTDGQSQPSPQFRGRSKPKSAFTRGEKFSLAVLAVLFAAGLLLLQFRRASESDLQPIVIEGAVRLDSSLPGPASSGDPAGGSRGVVGGFAAGRDQAGSPDEGSSPPVEKRVASFAERIDINRVGERELERLPGIGPVLAKRIVEFRKTRGPFLRVEDLMLVKGIGEKRFRKLETLVTVMKPGESSDGL